MLKNFRKIFVPFAFILGAISILPSCKVAKHLPQGQSLLVRNKFIIKTKASSGERGKIKDDLAKIAIQKPNKAFLGFIPLRMGIYYSVARSKKLTKFKQWMLDKVGEAPVVFDSTVTDRSRDLMQYYLFNFGYFHATVKDTVITKNKKTTILYTVNTDTVWTIREVELPKGHTIFDSIVRDNWRNTFLHKGTRYDVSNLINERVRIETLLKNNGYFFFNREYVTFDFDSFVEDKSVTIKIILNNPNDKELHEQYYLNNVYIVTDYSADNLEDSTARDTITVGEYKLLYHNLKLRPKVILDAIFLRKNELYSRDAEIRTQNQLQQLGTFKYININYENAKDRKGNYLDCIINLTPAKKQSWGWSIDLNVDQEGLFGTGGSLSYKNGNLTKRADQLIVTSAAGVQVRFPILAGDKEKQKVQLMNITLSAGATYYLNKFLVPFRAKLFSPNAHPKTRLSLNYNFEHRYDFDSTGKNVLFLYQLHNFNASFGYEWDKRVQRGNNHHLFNPIALQFFLLPKTGEVFTQRLDQTPILKSSFEEQVIIGPNYSYFFSNRKTVSAQQYMTFHTTMETAGNVIYGFFKAASQKDFHDSLYLILNRPFAQFFRIDADWRNFIRMTNHSTFAIRTYAGIGVPYGNSYALPFVKQFYVGGPNDLRGFQIREVGPGSYYDPGTFDPRSGTKTTVGFFNQNGDIKLETNAEIRFDIYRWFKAAVFADAGNVWTLNKDAVPGGNFDPKRFWSEFAVDAGAGIRLDFNYFVVRFDYGFPLRDPRRIIGERWQFQNAVAFKNGAFQLAIDYPF